MNSRKRTHPRKRMNSSKRMKRMQEQWNRTTSMAKMTKRKPCKTDCMNIGQVVFMILFRLSALGRPASRQNIHKSGVDM